MSLILVTEKRDASGYSARVHSTRELLPSVQESLTSELLMQNSDAQVAIACDGDIEGLFPVCCHSKWSFGGPMSDIYTGFARLANGSQGVSQSQLTADQRGREWRHVVLSHCTNSASLTQI